MKCFNYLVVATMIFGATLTSCKENDENPKEFNVSLLGSIFVSEHNALSDNIHQIKHEYEYGCQNRITIRETASYGYSGFLLYYNVNGDTMKYTSCYTSSRCYRSTFTKNGNKVKISIRYHPTVYLFGSVNGELELNEQGLPIKLTYEEEYDNDGSTYWSYTTVILTWQNGNLTTAECEEDWESENVIFDWEKGEIDRVEKKQGSNANTKTYTYDDKKTPFYFCNTPKWALWLLNHYERDVN